MLATAAVLIPVCELVFAFDEALSFGMLVASNALLVLGWLVLVFRGWRTALAGTAAAAAVLLALAAGPPGLRPLSWRMLVSTHRAELAQIVEILRPARAEAENVARGREPVCAGAPAAGLSPGECASLEGPMRALGASRVWTEAERIVLQTYAGTRVRGGLMYCERDCYAPSPGAPTRNRRLSRVSGAWYRWSQ